ncbi:arginase family protein [Heyndrickxia ginsengihumi]
MMGLLNKGITILQFDDIYDQQQKLYQFPHETINLKKLLHVNLYCEEKSLALIKSRLKQRKYKGITFLGNGNYHYVSYLLLQELTKPFSLVLFDNHPDLDINHDAVMLSCGTWVSYALHNIPMLQKVVIIGPTTIKESIQSSELISIFPFNHCQDYSTKLILSTIHTDDIYISIDKDVLNHHDAETNWDQGMMDKATLLNYIKELIRGKTVHGLDICGEPSISPLDYILPQSQKMLHKNEATNTEIIQTCLHDYPHHIIGA